MLEVSTSGQRLQRIFELLSSCRYSIHDLSRVELSAGRYPRFNMPFEAGLASALVLSDAGHERFVFESRSHRVSRTCSDLDGIDVKVHRGRAKGVLRAVLNAFTRQTSPPTLARLRVLHKAVRRRSLELKREHGTLYEAHPFQQLAAYAVAHAVELRHRQAVTPGLT